MNRNDANLCTPCFCFCYSNFLHILVVAIWFSTALILLVVGGVDVLGVRPVIGYR